LILVAMAFFLMAGSGIHRNWLFWIMPLMAVSVSLRLWSSDTDQTETMARVSIATAGGSSGSP
jgi:cytochrome c-type biogenesis protein CcmH/NrfF